MSRLVVGFGDGEPFEVDGEFQLVWEPADGSLPAVPGGVLRVDPVEVSFEASPEFLAWFEEAAAGLPEARERRAAEHRRAWWGPGQLERQITRAYEVTPAEVGLVPKSAFSSEYRRWQRARVKRRRR